MDELEDICHVAIQTNSHEFDQICLNYMTDRLDTSSFPLPDFTILTVVLSYSTYVGVK